MTVFVPPDDTSVLRYRNPVILFWIIPALVAWSGAAAGEVLNLRLRTRAEVASNGETPGEGLS